LTCFEGPLDLLLYLVTKAEPKVLFVGTRYTDMMKSIKSKIPSVKHFIVIDGEAEGMLSYDDLIASGSPEEKTFVDIKEEDTAY
jgi:hypothetical protein